MGSRHGKVSFRLWTAHDTQGSATGSAMSSNRVIKVLSDLELLVRTARTPLVAIGGPVAKAAGSDQALAISSMKQDSSLWQAASSAGEMPLTEVIYRDIFDAQLMDDGLLPVFVGELFAKG